MEISIIQQFSFDIKDFKTSSFEPLVGDQKNKNIKNLTEMLAPNSIYWKDKLPLNCLQYLN